MRKMEKLQALLADPENTKFNFASFDQLALPLDPEVSDKKKEKKIDITIKSKGMSLAENICRYIAHAFLIPAFQRLV